MIHYYIYWSYFPYTCTIVMLFNFEIIFSSMKIIFSKRKMKHFLIFGIIIILGKLNIYQQCTLIIFHIHFNNSTISFIYRNFIALSISRNVEKQIQNKHCKMYIHNLTFHAIDKHNVVNEFCLFVIVFSLFTVFCLYKSFVSEELMYSFDSNKYSSLISSKQQRSAAQSFNSINDVVDGELASSYNELNDARQRLRLLEMKIQTLENRIAKKYPDVLFLNYKNRKRILV